MQILQKAPVRFQSLADEPATDYADFIVAFPLYCSTTTKTPQVFAVRRFAVAVGKNMKLFIIYPAIAPCNLLDAGYLESLTLGNCTDEICCIGKGLVRTSVEPRYPTRHLL